MKTPKEIEQLAKQLCNIPIDLVIDEEERYYKNLDKYDGIIQGYTQCQEDNAEKKYTEEDIKQAIIYGMNTKQIDWGMVDEFIKSLNKQE